MNLKKIVSIILFILAPLYTFAETTNSVKPKNATTAVSKSKDLKAAEFHDSIFKMYKAFKTEEKDLQIQFINKQFNQDIENEKILTDLKKQIKSDSSAEQNKSYADLIAKKSKEYQAKSKEESDAFYSKSRQDRTTAFFDKINKLTTEFYSKFNEIKK